MSDPTKACNLTEEEIHSLITNHGQKLYMTNKEELIERINYLNKRLKAFKEPEALTMTGTEIKEKQTQGWGNNG